VTPEALVSRTGSDLPVDCDVVVLGGGPAGATCAALLARDGHRVVVLEKESFPRFHIGESLLPCDLAIFDRLGLALDRGPFLRKAGAEFLDERTGDHEEFLFADGLPGTPGHAYQVERSLFDDAVLSCAGSSGAIVRCGARVVDVSLGPERVEVAITGPAPAGTSALRARFLVDATGQDALLARRHRTVQPIRGFGVVAAFCHFDRLPASAAGELEVTGNIHVLMRDEGWMWLIPLHGGRLSCGVVTRTPGAGPGLLDAAIASSPHVQRLTAGATRSSGRIVRNFSFRNARSSGARWACVGDASIFLDPVFSSGVSLGMLAAERLAGRVSLALRANAEDDPELAGPVHAAMRTAYVTFASLIGAFYRTRLVEHIFFAPEPDPELRAGLISILAGDVWREDNRFQRSLLDSPKRRIDPFEG
jgi:flavin-dependent dehydrogenase